MSGFGIALTACAGIALLAVSSHAQDSPGLQPFYTAPAATPAATPLVRRALPITPETPAPAAPTPAPRRRVPSDAPAAPTGDPAGAPSAPTPPTVQRRAAPAPSPGGDAASGDNGDIRLAPGQTGGPTITPDALQLNVANSLYLKKDYAQAAVEYEKYLGMYPQAPAGDRQSALWFMAESYRQSSRPNAALTTYEALLSQFTEGQFVGPANYQLGTLYFDGKNYQGALPLFARSASLSKSDDVLLASYYYEALCLEKLDRAEETKEIYGHIIAIPANNPYRETARLALAKLAVQEKHPGEALEQYEALSKESTRPLLRAEATIKAGLLAKEVGQLAKAETLLARGASMSDMGQLRVTAAMELLHLYYDSNKYQKLIDTYQSNSKAIPDDQRAEAMLLAGNAERQLGHHNEALTIYDQLMTQYPNAPQVPEARYQRIISLYTTASPDFLREADDFLLLNSDPAKGDKVKLMKADTLFRKEDYAAAAVAYAAVEASPRLEPKYRVETMYRLGYSYIQSKQPEKAIDAFTEFIKAFPEEPLVAKALAQRALACQQLKNYDDALRDFDDLIDNHRDAKEREMALDRKALILGEKDDVKGMMATFATLLKDYPKTDDAAQAHYFIATGAFEAKDFTTAAEEFDAARKTGAKEYGARASLHVVLCMYQLQDKDKLAAEVEAYEKAKYQPSVPAQVLQWLGDKEYESKEYAAAERHLSEAAASPTNDAPDIWLRVARCRLFLKKPSEALDAADKFIASVGADPGAHANGLLVQGEALLALKKYDDAQKSADGALQLQPEGTLNARGRLLGGDIALARGRYEDAGKAYLSVSILTDDPDITPEALRKAAEAFRKAGRPEDAAKALEDLKTRFPGAADQAGT